MKTTFCFCVKYFDKDYTCQIHERNYFKVTDKPEEYLKLVENHVSKMDDYGELFTSFYHKVEF